MNVFLRELAMIQRMFIISNFVWRFIISCLFSFVALENSMCFFCTKNVYNQCNSYGMEQISDRKEY